MCGIFGHTITINHDRDHSRRALHTLAHRGPDQWRDWEDEKAYLGHRRLSIIDLSEAGRQPMISEDGKVILTANGEIYNFKSLRAELEPHFNFTSHSDSEILLHGYRYWGIDGLLARLDGMFAFVIYDKVSGLVHLVRDQVGIKPLYYGEVDGRLIWASELKAIEEFTQGNSLSTDYTAIYDYLTYLYIPAPKSMYKEVRKLPPAHLLTYSLKDKSSTLKCYWQLKTDVVSTTHEQAAIDLRNVIAESIKLQQVADVPVGFFLSGGMDSSAVVAEAAMMGGDLHSYTIGFNDRGRDESPYAKMVAEHYHTRHTIKRYNVEDTNRMLPLMREWYDEPFADFSAFPTYLVSKLARESATVVLTGDGGDEVFGGYKWYKRFERFYYSSPCSPTDSHMGRGSRLARPYGLATVLSPFRGILSWLKNNHRQTIFGKVSNKLENHAITDPLELYAKLMGGMLKADKKHLRQQWNIPDDYDDYWVFRKWWRDDLPFYTRLQYLDFHTYLPDDILTKVDRTSMSVALEARVPLLALPVVEFAFSLPEEIRLPDGELKGLFKAAYQDLLPPAIISRGKQGFSIPASKMGFLRTADRKPPQLVALEKLFGIHSNPV